MRKSEDHWRQAVQLHQVGIDAVILELHRVVPTLHLIDFQSDGHELAVGSVHVLQALQDKQRVSVRLRRFYALLNYIIDKAVVLTPPPANLLALDLSADGGELALALLAALAQLRPQPD